MTPKSCPRWTRRFCTWKRRKCRCMSEAWRSSACPRLQGRLLRGLQGDDRLAAARRADPQSAAGKGAARHRSSLLGRGRPVRYRPPYLPRQPSGAPRSRDAGAHRRLDACQASQSRPSAVGVLCLRRHEGQRDRALFQDASRLHRRRRRRGADQHDLRRDAGPAENRAADGAGQGRAGAARHRRQPHRFLSAALAPAVRRLATAPRASICRARERAISDRSCSTTPCSRSNPR